MESIIMGCDLSSSTTLAFVEKHWLLFLAFSLLLLHRLAIITYNLYFHPLARFPGPRYLAISNLPYYYLLSVRGTAAHHVVTWHKTYGDIVRIRPNELSFKNAAAWTDIMGHRAGPENSKDPHFYSPVTVGPPNLATAPRAQHQVFRRLMSHGFSEASMRAQEPLIRGYVDLLIRRLRENSSSSGGVGGGEKIEKGERNSRKAVGMAAGYNCTTFDVSGDLAFGEPFGCLRDSAMHPWIQVVTSMGRFTAFLQFVSLYPLLKMAILAVMPPSVKNAGYEHARLAKEKVWEGFHPERFLGDDRFKNDNLKSFQPFNVGPRDCAGRKILALLLRESLDYRQHDSLAYAEMRLILARVLHNFDLQIA
ncbi:cytochrome P450 [Aspergillus heterothallicus]